MCVVPCMCVFRVMACVTKSTYTLIKQTAYCYFLSALSEANFDYNSVFVSRFTAVLASIPCCTRVCPSFVQQYFGTSGAVTTHRIIWKISHPRTDHARYKAVTDCSFKFSAVVPIISCSCVQQYSSSTAVSPQQPTGKCVDASHGSWWRWQTYVHLLVLAHPSFVLRSNRAFDTDVLRSTDYGVYGGIKSSMISQSRFMGSRVFFLSWHTGATQLQHGAEVPLGTDSVYM